MFVSKWSQAIPARAVLAPFKRSWPVERAGRFFLRNSAAQRLVLININELLVVRGNMSR